MIAIHKVFLFLFKLVFNCITCILKVLNIGGQAEWTGSKVCLIRRFWSRGWHVLLAKILLFSGNKLISNILHGWVITITCCSECKKLFCFSSSLWALAVKIIYIHSFRNTAATAEKVKLRFTVTYTHKTQCFSFTDKEKDEPLRACSIKQHRHLRHPPNLLCESGTTQLRFNVTVTPQGRAECEGLIRSLQICWDIKKHAIEWIQKTTTVSKLLEMWFTSLDGRRLLNCLVYKQLLL